jgi:integrase
MRRRCIGGQRSSDARALVAAPAGVTGVARPPANDNHKEATRITSALAGAAPALPPEAAGILAQLAIALERAPGSLHNSPQLPLSENQREEADGTAGKESDMCRIDGPFKHRDKFQVRVVDRETKKTKTHTFPTEEEALAAIPKIRREYRRPIGVPVSQALEAYAGYLAIDRQNRSTTIETTIGRVRSLFRDRDALTDELTPACAREWWQSFKTTPVSKAGKLPSIDTQVGVLKQSRTFAAWLVEKGWTKRADLLDGIVVLGKRRKGKPQLRTDDAVKYEGKARELADKGDVGAIAALVPYYMGNRAGEVVSRRARDLDAKGTVLVIEHAKTEAGNRRLRIVPELQPYLQRLAHGKQPDAPLFTGSTPRARRALEKLADPVGWLRRQVARVCKLAGVPVVGPHGLRGTFATLAVDAGNVLERVASELGHDGTAVTRGHYVRQEALDNAQIERAAAARAAMN